MTDGFEQDYQSALKMGLTAEKMLANIDDNIRRFKKYRGRKSIVSNNKWGDYIVAATETRRLLKQRIDSD